MIRVQFRAAIGSHTKIACSGEKGKKRKSERANAREIKGRELEEGVNARGKESFVGGRFKLERFLFPLFVTKMVTFVDLNRTTFNDREISSNYFHRFFYAIALREMKNREF